MVTSFFLRLFLSHTILCPVSAWRCWLCFSLLFCIAVFGLFWSVEGNSQSFLSAHLGSSDNYICSLLSVLAALLNPILSLFFSTVSRSDMLSGCFFFRLHSRNDVRHVSGSMSNLELLLLCEIKILITNRPRRSVSTAPNGNEAVKKKRH
jgi:hypothetical protein